MSRKSDREGRFDFLKIFFVSYGLNLSYLRDSKSEESIVICKIVETLTRFYLG